MSSAFQSEYQTSYNETDLINQIKSASQNRMIKYRDTFTFGKKSFLNNDLTTNNNIATEQYHQNQQNNNDLSLSSYIKSANNNNQQKPSVPLATSRIQTTTSTNYLNQYKSIALNLQQQDSNTVYNQHYNYVGAEPHISERIHTYNGAFGPKVEEITQALKIGTNKNDILNNTNNTSRPVSYSYNTQLPQINNNNNNNNIDTNNEDKQKTSSASSTKNNNYLYSSIDQRPQVRSYDFRPVWIPKKYPGRNMFHSHLDSSIFPGKYDVTDQVWNSLSDGTSRDNKSSSNTKLDQLLTNPSKTEYSQIKVPSFTKNSGFIIHPTDKSILPTVRTDHVKAAELTKKNQFIDNSLYHLSL